MPYSARERRKPVSGLRRNHHAGATTSNDIPALFEDERCAVPVNFENCGYRSLTRRDPGRVNKACNIAATGGVLD